MNRIRASILREYVVGANAGSTLAPSVNAERKPPARLREPAPVVVGLRVGGLEEATIKDWGRRVSATDGETGSWG